MSTGRLHPYGRLLHVLNKSLQPLTLYTTLPHNLIKEKPINLIEWTFKREGSLYIACNERQAFFTSGDTKRYKLLVPVDKAANNVVVD